MHIQLFGEHRFAVNGQPAVFATQKSKALAAYLALHPGVHSRDKLADLLWPNTSQENARNSLRVELVRLRKALGDASVLATRDTLQFAPAQVDVLEFQRLIDLPSPAARDLRTAIDLYVGALLPELDEPWLIPMREELHGLWTSAAARLAQQLLAGGMPAEALVLAQRALKADALDEALHRAAMRALADLGRHAEALAQYERCEQTLRSELGAQPERETRALAGAIKAMREAAPQPVSSAAGPAPARSTRRIAPLPHAVNAFIGRNAELAQLRDLLLDAGGPRLVTVAGAGGSGKTRFVLEGMRGMQSALADGVVWIELAGLKPDGSVGGAVADALGLNYATETALLPVLLADLASARLCLVLDNCEHVVSACAELVERLLAACPDVRIVTTSRELLGIMGEHVFPLRTLSVPASGTLESLEQSEAGRMLAARVRAANPLLVINGQNAQAAVAICTRLDGIPLAIELAASKTRSLTLEQIAQRLGDRFSLLTGGARTALPRQQTLRSLISWSYDLLTPQEQRMFAVLSVFRGGWTLEAAEAVCSVDGAEVIELLNRLVDKSLVTVQMQADGARYTMLETLREYAMARLDEQKLTTEARTRHYAWCHAFARDQREQLDSVDHGTWVRRLDREQDNFRAALDMCLQMGDARQGLGLLGELEQYLVSANRYVDGMHYARALLALPHGDALAERAAGLRVAINLGMRMNLAAEVAPHAHELLGFARASGNGRMLAEALRRAAMVHALIGEYDQSEQCAREAMLQFQASGDPIRANYARIDLGEALRWQGRFADAVVTYQDALRQPEARSDTRLAAILNMNLALAYAKMCDVPNALQACADAWRSARNILDESSWFYIAFALGWTALHVDELQLAALGVGTSAGWMATSGFRVYAEDARDFEAVTQACRIRLGDEFESRARDGMEMGMASVIQHLLQALRPPA